MSNSQTKRKYISQNTQQKKNLCDIADALRQQSSFREAISSYLNAILIDRENANSYYGLGLCYKNLENYKKAIRYFEKATTVNPEFYEAFYELGICHLREGIPCGAIKSFVQAIKINPEKPDAILQLGIAHQACEEDDMALMIFQKLIENSPKYIKGYEHKAELLIKLGKYKDASLLFNQIIKINPEYYRAYLGIGKCFEKLGMRVDAQRYYRKFLIKKPNSHNAPFVKSRLERLRKLNKSNPFNLIS